MQSVFLCLTRPVFSQEMDIFIVVVRNKSTKSYHYLDSYRVISTVVKMSTPFYLSFFTFVCPIRAETIENCGGFVNFITLTCKPGDPGRPAGPVMPRKP